jgi:hypothetical protein
LTKRLDPDRPRRNRLPSTRNIAPDEGHVIPPWYDQARCKAVGPAVFYNDPPAHALRLCAECPVRAECRDFALKGGTVTEYGVWGGLTQEQRNQLRLSNAFESGRLKPHCPGTEGAYQQHRRNHEPPCTPCVMAHSRANRERRMA